MESKKGFTLLELMTAAGIIIIALSGLLFLFVKINALNERANSLSLATASIQNKMEEIRRTDFAAISTTFDNTPFVPSGFSAGNAMGSISVEEAIDGDATLLRVFLSVSWRESSNRIIGEDADLDGHLDGGEDTNTDGELSSPAQIITLMANR